MDAPGQNTGTWRTDRQTNKRTTRSYYSGMYCEQCGRRVL